MADESISISDIKDDGAISLSDIKDDGSVSIDNIEEKSPASLGSKLVGSIPVVGSVVKKYRDLTDEEYQARLDAINTKQDSVSNNDGIIGRALDYIGITPGRVNLEGFGATKAGMALIDTVAPGKIEQLAEDTSNRSIWEQGTEAWNSILEGLFMVPSMAMNTSMDAITNIKTLFNPDVTPEDISRLTEENRQALGVGIKALGYAYAAVVDIINEQGLGKFSQESFNDRVLRNMTDGNDLVSSLRKTFKDIGIDDDSAIGMIKEIGLSVVDFSEMVATGHLGSKLFTIPTKYGINKVKDVANSKAYLRNKIAGSQMMESALEQGVRSAETTNRIQDAYEKLNQRTGGKLEIPGQSVAKASSELKTLQEKQVAAEPTQAIKDIERMKFLRGILDRDAQNKVKTVDQPKSLIGELINDIKVNSIEDLIRLDKERASASNTTYGDTIRSSSDVLSTLPDANIKQILKSVEVKKLSDPAYIAELKSKSDILSRMSDAEIIAVMKSVSEKGIDKVFSEPLPKKTTVFSTKELTLKPTTKPKSVFEQKTQAKELTKSEEYKNNIDLINEMLDAEANAAENLAKTNTKLFEETRKGVAEDLGVAPEKLSPIDVSNAVSESISNNAELGTQQLNAWQRLKVRLNMVGESPTANMSKSFVLDTLELMKQYGESGKAAASLVDQSIDVTMREMARRTKEVSKVVRETTPFTKKITGVTKKEQVMMSRFHDGEIKSLPTRLKKIYDTVRTSYDNMLQEAINRSIQVEDVNNPGTTRTITGRDNYANGGTINPKLLKRVEQGGDRILRERAIAAIKSRHPAETLVQAAARLDRMIEQPDNPILGTNHQSGFLHYSRYYGIKGSELFLDNYYKYAESITKEFVSQDLFGNANVELFKLMDAASKEAGVPREYLVSLADKASGNMVTFDPALKGMRDSRLIKMAKNWEYGSKMWLGAITNISTINSINAAFPAKAIANGFAKTATDWGNAKQRAIDAGLQIDNVLSESNGVSRLTKGVFKATGLNLSETIVRTYTSEVAQAAARDWFDVVKQDPMNVKNKKVVTAYRALTELGIDTAEAVRRGHLSETDFLNASQQGSKWAIPRITKGDMPVWASHPLGSLAFQFKSYAYGQAKILVKDIIYDEIYANAKKGAPTISKGKLIEGDIVNWNLKNANFKPLLKYFATAAVTGHVINILKKIAKGKDISNYELLDLQTNLEAQLVGGSLGILGDSLQASGYGVAGMLGASAGPVIGNWASAVSAARQMVFEGKTTQAAKYIRSQVPQVLHQHLPQDLKDTLNIQEQ